MQPITTRHKGYRFRSRLEARWAVYFEMIGLEWDYEKEGFIFDNGIRYLPDFWLPQVKMWAEVKPGDFDKEELEKVYSLVQENQFSCILLDGSPKTMKTYNVIEYSDSGLEFSKEIVIYMYHGYPIFEERFYSNPGGLAESDFEEGGSFSDVAKAVEAACSARFEHGEHGA